MYLLYVILNDNENVLFVLLRTSHTCRVHLLQIKHYLLSLNNILMTMAQFTCNLNTYIRTITFRLFINRT